MKILFSSLFLIFLLSNCGLRYTPQITPEEAQIIRRDIIEGTLVDEFKAQDKSYTPIAYANSVKIKPVSYQKLDSLFSQKLQLEKVRKTNPALEEEIKKQQVICQNDTNQIFWMERHIFTLEADSIAEILSGDFYFDTENQLKDVKFTESYHINKNYINFYQLYVFEQPFMGDSYLSDEEKDFYRVYKSELQNRSNKDAFMELTLQLMQVAYYKRSLNTETLLKELTRKKVHNDKSNYSDEVFLKIEQLTENDILKKYHIEYQSATRSASGMYTKRYSLNFDPYLMLINISEIPIQ